jgi:hypothetical protein
MKKINFVIVPALLLLPTLSWAWCSKGGIIVQHSTEFGVSFGSGGSSSNSSDQQSINVPLSIDGKEACFRKKTSFTLRAEDTVKREKVKSEGRVIITPMTVDFRNVPSPHFKQYIYAERNPDISKAKFHVMGFICSGSMPLSIEAHSDLYAKLVEKSAKSSNGVTEISFTIATGAAAEALERNRPKPKKGAVSSKETFDTFLNIYRQKANHSLEDVPVKHANIPNLLMESSVSSLGDLERKIATKFTTMGPKVINGCSKIFSEVMSDYQVENIKNNPSLKSFNIGKKGFSKNIVIDWKN